MRGVDAALRLDACAQRVVAADARLEGASRLIVEQVVEVSVDAVGLGDGAFLAHTGLPSVPVRLPVRVMSAWRSALRLR